MKKKDGFTIVELLAVIAIIGVLSAILIPTVGRVRTSAKETQTRAQFSQWITAIEMFRTEYGYWPDFRAEGPDWKPKPLDSTHNNLIIRPNEDANLRKNFIEFLSGRHPDGTSFEPPYMYKAHPNRKRISFYEFSENDYRFRDGGGSQVNRNADNIELVDAFGNTDIVIVMDGDLNGIIPLNEGQNYTVRNEESSASVPRVAPYHSGGSGEYSYSGAARDVRASVIIYSPGKAATSQSEAYINLIRSW